MWWASAGENRTDLDEEGEYDAALLRHYDSPQSGNNDESSNLDWPRSAKKSLAVASMGGMDGRMMETQSAALEITIIAYFHRLTTLILKTLADVIDATDDASDIDDTGYDENGSFNDDDAAQQSITKGKDPTVRGNDAITVSNEDMARMGLDVWSETDREFVRELVAFYFGRKAEVRGGKVECCGVRIC